MQRAVFPQEAPRLAHLHLALLEFFLHHSRVVVFDLAVRMPATCLPYDPRRLFTHASLVLPSQPGLQAFFGSTLSAASMDQHLCLATLTFVLQNVEDLQATRTLATFFPNLLKMLAWSVLTPPAPSLSHTRRRRRPSCSCAIGTALLSGTRTPLRRNFWTSCRPCWTRKLAWRCFTACWISLASPPHSS